MTVDDPQGAASMARQARLQAKALIQSAMFTPLHRKRGVPGKEASCSMPEPLRMAALSMFALLPLTACNVTVKVDQPPVASPVSRVVATPGGFAIETITPDDGRPAAIPLVPLGRTIRLDPALLGSPSPSLFRSTLHAPFLQIGPPGPIGNEHDGRPGPDEHGSPRTGASRTGGEQ